jgi:rare lipoprotein A
MKRKYVQWYIFVIFLIAGVGCSSTVRFAQNDSLQADSGATAHFRVGQQFVGMCSYYATQFHGKKTANGEIYNMQALTAAHRTLPFNTIIEVENLSNGKKVRVRVNDRGPFKKGRILDVSLKAAKELGLLQSGTARVKITIIQLGKSKHK